MSIFLIFNGIRDVIKAEKICIDRGVKYAVRPVPSHLSSECGMCLEIKSDMEAIEKEIYNHGITFTKHDQL